MKGQAIAHWLSVVAILCALMGGASRSALAEEMTGAVFRLRAGTFAGSGATLLESTDPGGNIGTVGTTLGQPGPIGVMSGPDGGVTLVTLGSGFWHVVGGIEEICDGIDNNQDGRVDEGFPNTDGDDQADCVDLDDDDDGMPDDWEIANNLDPLDEDDAGQDPDDDGYTSLEEFEAGTGPHDWNSSPNQPPEAAIDSPVADLTVLIGESIDFSGTGTDADGHLPLSYRWEFGEGSGIPASEEQNPGVVTFNYTGLFPVTLQVTDSLGRPDPTPAILTVTVQMPPAGSAAAQEAALRELEGDSEEEPYVRFEGKVPPFVGARVPLPDTLPDDLVARAIDFLNRYRDLYRLYDPCLQLYLKRIVRDGDGGQHLFFGQRAGDVPVFHTDLAVHFRNGEVVGTGGNYLTETPALPPPALSTAQAEAAALAAATGTDLTVSGVTTLGYYNAGLISRRPSDTQLAWRVFVRGLLDPDGIAFSWAYMIDAHSGEMLLEMDLTKTADREEEDFYIATANNTFSSDCWSLSTDPVQWFDEEGPTAGYPGGSQNYPGGDTDGDNAFDFLHEVYHYFYDSFDRRGHSGEADREEVYVRVGTNWANAGYSWGCDEFEFGDGYITLDVLAHEFTHGITDAVQGAGSGTAYSDEPGALNESYSDVFGVLVDLDDWTIGEDLPKGSGFRDFSDPPAGNPWQPDHMSDLAPHWVELPPCPACNLDGICDWAAGETCSHPDHGRVHTNSGIPNKVAYLLIQGGEHNGILVRPLGPDKTARLYYEVFTSELGVVADFDDAKDATIAKAAEYASEWKHGFVFADDCNVRNAFASVGLGSPDVDCDGTLDNVDPDDDGDSRPDGDDNCPTVFNPDQADRDSDGEGDACDTDGDADGVLDYLDNCPDVANADQEDDDFDGKGEVCDDDDGDDVFNPDDNCRYVRNDGQADADDDGQGDACDTDDDDDGLPDAEDNCQVVPNPGQEDRDEDGVGDACDNCIDERNIGQGDMDEDGVGDACDADIDGDGIANAVDPCPRCHNPPTEPLLNNTPMSCLRCEGFFQSIINKIRFVVIPEIIRIPIFPCIGGLGGGPVPLCPRWMPESYRSEVRVSLGVAMATRIVDDLGVVVAKASPSLTPSLLFKPRADYFYLPPVGGGGAGVRAGDEAAGALSCGQVPYRGRSYFLELLPSEGLQPGEEYPIAIEVVANNDGDSVGNEEDNCPNVQNDLQLDTDGNGIGDACQCGDVNMDGYTNVTDALLIARGQVPSADPGFDRGDVNGDTFCNVTDALMIAKGQVSSAHEDQHCPTYRGF